MTTAPPEVVTLDLTNLGAALSAAIPARTESNVLVATWNVRAFGDLTNKWLAGPRDSPKRDWHVVACIAEVVSRFDVIALQEARRSTKALRFLLERLGPTWKVIASDVTEGSPATGNDWLSSTIRTASSPQDWSGRSSCLPSRPIPHGSSPAPRTSPASAARGQN